MAGNSNLRDSAENGVRGYGGRLNIRPAFQREFIYKDRQRDAVIRTRRLREDCHPLLDDEL